MIITRQKKTVSWRAIKTRPYLFPFKLRLSKEGCFYVLGNYAADPKQHYLLKPDICVMVIA